ncbi:hypothetical protein SKAU_G00429670 [Synaphobranchus kaupii]|uniref:Uncharacterized protein n=1 Tax=Synaphobranchus kaupii TaxID=118154 RepID=A0A9Q1E4I3_SYNKA|nr:hypothetical protein SKAU_G00429670 [Synaphobranchus kaupii]
MKSVFHLFDKHGGVHNTSSGARRVRPPPAVPYQRQTPAALAVRTTERHGGRQDRQLLSDGFPRSPVPQESSFFTVGASLTVQTLAARLRTATGHCVINGSSRCPRYAPWGPPARFLAQDASP